MDRFQRILELNKAFNAHHYPVSRQTLQDKLECSSKTVERTIRDMRDYLNAPIRYDREANGYCMAAGENGPFELPGLWFNANELAALCILDQLLGTIEPGLLADELKPARQRFQKLMTQTGLDHAHLQKRVRIINIANRQPGKAFMQCAEALLLQKQLTFTYHARSSDQRTQRLISPQRITHYRDNWYLDAWCHHKNALRTFSIDRIHTPQIQTKPAKQIDKNTLNQTLTVTYGVFAGPAKHCAKLEFSAERARWVADEYWHPEQRSQWLPDGRYQLTIPYGDDRELIGDILRHGAHVEVKSPKELHQKIKTTIQNMAELYK